jgi:DNA-binding NtrC family response regulator
MLVDDIQPMCSPKRVLVVDDNEVIREALHDVLGRDYTVETVGNAALAMKAIIQHQPDAILLDIRMPGVDGLSLLKSLREMSVRMPIIIMTGYDSKCVAIEAMEHGANGYLPKPFDLIHLQQLLANVVDSSTL